MPAAGPALGLVALDVPLISNLDVMANVALIKQYHEDMPRRHVERLVMGLLRRYGMAGIAGTRNPALTGEERFCVMLLRAACVRDAHVVVDRPFLLLPQVKDAARLYELLGGVSDLYTRCCICDYGWNRSRYQVSDGAQH
jgi:ABC-type lipoprotein export system ATPase subunit